MEFPNIVSYLLEHLGPAAMALIADASTKTVRRWATSQASPQSPEMERRVRTAYQVFQIIQQEEAPQTVRAWFLGMNPQLEDDAPVEALAAGREREVLSAARAFVAGG